MKPEYEKILDRPERSFTAKVVNRKNRPYLSQAWHYHPEIEICYTLKSHGRRFVGNQVSDYQERDLVMFGSNLPHGFTTDYYCSQVVIQMNYDFLGRDFVLKPEMQGIKNLFDYSKRGIDFSDETKKRADKIIVQLLENEGMKQLLYLLELLNILAEAKDAKDICSEEYALDFNENQLGRVKIVCDHILQNFTKEVSIKEIADKLNLSEAAFYKFIKRQTQKTYTQIINEFRISHACKLLMNTEKTIAQICFESGYNNISYFNRKFKKVMQQTPIQFKNRYTS